jgi:hypothetical protein
VFTRPKRKDNEHIELKSLATNHARDVTDDGIGAAAEEKIRILVSKCDPIHTSCKGKGPSSNVTGAPPNTPSPTVPSFLPGQ